jgi:hypothetical protein
MICCASLFEGRNLLAYRSSDEDSRRNERAQFAGNTLAWHFHSKDRADSLFLFQGINGNLIGTFPFKGPLFTLSPDGKRIALQKADHGVEIFDLHDGLSLKGTLPWASLHNNLIIRSPRNETLGAPEVLEIEVGKHSHCFLLNEKGFQHSRRFTEPNRNTATNSTGIMPIFLRRQRERFSGHIPIANLIAVRDSWGQVILVDKESNIVAYILIRVLLTAIILPDGTAWGPVSLLGRPATPHAEQTLDLYFMEYLQQRKSDKSNIDFDQIDKPTYRL